jgi:hypothetical protein
VDVGSIRRARVHTSYLKILHVRPDLQEEDERWGKRSGALWKAEAGGIMYTTQFLQGVSTVGLPCQYSSVWSV